MDLSLNESILAGFDVSDGDVDSFVSSAVGLYGVDISRMSKLLLVQLTSASKHHTMCTFAVTDVIQELEGVHHGRISEVPRPFKGAALSGLWKVHFVDTKFLLRNIYNEWGIFNNSSNKFSKLCERVALEEAKSPTLHGWPGRLAHEFIIGGYEKRARRKKLTGEWLIFGIYEQKKIYLSLCKHSQSPEQDQQIYDGLKSLCGTEFPQLFSRDSGSGSNSRAG